MSDRWKLSNTQEVVLDFINTHLAMLVVFMPWKKTTLKKVEEGHADVYTREWYSLIDFESINKWKIGMNKFDDDLPARTNWLMGLAIALTVFTVLSFIATLFFPRDVKSRAGLDFVTLVLGSVVLILALTFQDGFDEFWKYKATQVGTGETLDWEQTFLVVVVLPFQILISLALFGDKVRELTKY